MHWFTENKAKAIVWVVCALVVIWFGSMVVRGANNLVEQVEERDHSTDIRRIMQGQ